MWNLERGHHKNNLTISTKKGIKFNNEGINAIVSLLGRPSRLMALEVVKSSGRVI